MKNFSKNFGKTFLVEFTNKLLIESLENLLEQFKKGHRYSFFF